MSGREKTIKAPKVVENITNCSNNINKGSRSMFVSQFDMCLCIVNKVVKHN